jgi:hypothetical protein
MTNEKQQRIPKIGEYVRLRGELIEVIEEPPPPPPPPTKFYVFEDTEARVESRVNGHVVQTFSTFNNWYGRDTCIQSAIDSAKEEQARLGTSDMEFVVVKITRRGRLIHIANSTYLYDSQFVRFEYPDRGHDGSETEEDVWSSKEPDIISVTSTN